MTERPRLAQREPRSLLPEQMGQLTVSTPAISQRVQAWILWEDGVEELVQAHAIAWTHHRSFLVSWVHNVLGELHLSSGRWLHPQHPEHPAYAGFRYPYFGIYMEMPVLYM